MKDRKKQRKYERERERCRDVTLYNTYFKIIYALLCKRIT